MIELKKIWQLFAGTSLQDRHELPVSEGKAPGQTKKYTVAQLKQFIWSFVSEQITEITQGPQGVQGAPGVQGIQGPKGDKGDKGDRGDTGLKGDVGSQGIQGIQGPKGDKGDKGDAGAQGLQGIPGEKGEQGDAGQTGAAGADGVGIPTGGTTGQVLKKNSNDDYDTEWGNAGVTVSDDVENQAGVVDDKAVSPKGLKNWWTWIKTQAFTLGELITFSTAPKLDSLIAGGVLSLDGNKNIESVLQKMTAVITSSTVIAQLTTESNWSAAGVYTGTAIVGVEQLQMYADAKYFYYFYDSTTPVRVSRNSVLHIIGNSGVPSVVAGAAAGIAPTVSISGTDLGFRIALTTGTTPTTGTLATVTFNRSYGAVPYVCISEKNANAATLTARPYNATTTTTLTLSIGTALAASTQYIWDFIVVQ